MSIRNSNWKSELLALVFGLLMVLVIFGDQAGVTGVGNLDTIFGSSRWFLMDIVYPLSSLIVFLIYGKSKGRLEINRRSVLTLLAFLVAQIVIQFDDFVVLFYREVAFPQIYWTVIRLVYLFAAPGAFLAFGSACAANARRRDASRKTP
jgi:hypothetical protein